METLSQKYHLSSANSINIGRLLPQCVYYVFASVRYFRQTQRSCNVLIPTGNMGNAFAAIMVKLMGFPIGEVHVVTNTNRVIPNYFETGVFESRSSISTLANAMDVGNPSNLERYIHLVSRHPSIANWVRSTSVNDDQITEAIAYAEQQWRQPVCPHTATAVHHYISQSIDDVVLVATAHPYKFHDVVDEILGRNVLVPDNLSKFLDPEPNVIDIKATIGELASVIASLVSRTS